MSIRASKSKRRALVLLNYFSMFALIAVIYTGEMYGGSTIIAVAAISLMLLTVLTFVFLHARTRLWWLTHTKVENLDERQQVLLGVPARLVDPLFEIVVELGRKQLASQLMNIC